MKITKTQLREMIREEIQNMKKEDYRVSPHHTFKTTPDGGIVLFGRKGKIKMSQDDLKNFLRGLIKKRIMKTKPLF